MKTKNNLLLIAGIMVSAIFLTSCKATTPVLGLSGANYNSITDDVLLYNSANIAVDELANAITVNKVLVVQTVEAPSSDLLAEKIFETLSKKGKVVGLAKRSNISTMDVGLFDKIVFFYPTVYGIETAATRPTKIAEMSILIPLVGPFVAPSIIEANTWDDRMGAVSIHARMVDSKTGQIEWMRVFQGKSQKRLTKKSVFDIILPR